MDVSVIIPYYNTGLYIEEAIASVQLYKGKYTYEIIIINDGSTDKYSLEVLNNIVERGDITVLHQNNMGPGAARNYGVQHAQGEFLLFLDSDNKIKPEYIEKAVKLLKQNAEIGVVYSNAEFFGEKTRNGFKTKHFNIDLLLMANYIDMCAFVRTTAFLEVGGFDNNNLLYVSEDWDLWLSIYQKKWEFRYIEEPLFFYRMRKDSLIGSDSSIELKEKRKRYIISKHYSLYIQQIKKHFELNEYIKGNKMKTIVKLLLNKRVL